MPQDEFDVCVIGTGAGGGVMLQELTQAGFKVVALERGPKLNAMDFMSDDELSIQIRDELFSPGQLESWRPDSGSTTLQGKFNNLAYCVGGTITHWGAWTWRFREDEFKVRSTEGPVVGASLVDWPISYGDMEPWYEKAEGELGVSGTSGANPVEAPRKTTFPNPPHPDTATTPHVRRALEALGYKHFPVPMSINSQPYNGRPGCTYGGACGGYGCPISAKASTLAIHIPKAIATGNLDLRADARVTELAVGSDGKVSGVRYMDSQGKEQEVKAKQVILSAGAIGSPHLLQMSQSSSFPDGLANSSGLVGKNLTYHHFPIVIYTLDQPTFNYTGIETLVATDDLHPSDSARGFIRGGVITDGNPFVKQPLGYSLGALNGHPNLDRAWGSKLKQALRDFPKQAQLTAILEDLPMESNRVDLDPDLKDQDGLPVPRITHAQHPNDLAMFQWFEKRMFDIADEAGAITSWAPTSSYRLVDEFSAMQGSVHIHGTCRMGDDPNKSVVDRWCRSHDVKNLWIVDGSFFPTAGGYNPTLTLMANAHRVADHFISEGKKGSI